MASRTADLIVRAKSQGTKQVAQDVGSIGDSAKKAGSELSGAFKGLAGLAVVGAIGSAVKAASTLEQSMGGVDRIFKGSAGAIHSWAKDTGDAFRVPAAEAEKFAASVGNSLIKAGATTEEATEKTKALAQVGADLAAAFGGTTSAAIDAVSGAIAKGEWERLESIGVNVKAADVAMEAAALSAGSMAGESQKAIDTQARINVLMREAAPAFGAAAAESDTFAAKQDAFNETLENTKATIGSALLPVMSDLMGTMTSAVSSLTPFATGLAGVVGWLLKLPAPILAVAAGIALWNFTSIGTSLSGLGKKFVDVASGAKSFGTSMASIGKGLAGGAALGAVSIILGSIFDWMGKVEGAADDAAGSLGPVEDMLVATGGAWSDVSRAAQDAALMNTDAFGELRSAGISAGDALQVLKGNADLWNEIQTNRPEGFNLTRETIIATDALLAQSNGLEGNAQRRLADAAATDVQIDAEGNYQAAAGESVSAADQLADALTKAKEAHDQTAAQGFLTEIKTQTEAASTALDVFTAAIDQVDGRLSNEDAVVGWTRGLQDLSTAFTESAAQGGVSTEALVAWDVVALQATEGSRNVYDALTQQATAYPALVAGAFSAAGGTANLAYATQAAMTAATDARGAFIATATQFGLTDIQAAALANSLGILDATQLDPKVFEIIAQDQAAAAAVAALQAQGIDAKSFEVTAVTDPATGAIEQVITYTDASGAKIEVGAETAPAADAIGDVAAAKYDATVKTNADTGPAAQTINSFTAQQRNAMIQVNANTAPAVAAVTTLVANTGGRTATIQVTANTGPAQAAINAVANGYYTATINVTANTASAAAAVAAIPRTITVTPVPTPAMAAMSVSAADFAAPAGAPQTVPAPHGPLRLSSTGASQDFGTVGATTININVSGALDPDATARAVNRLLVQRERRAYGVRVRTGDHRVTGGAAL